MAYPIGEILKKSRIAANFSIKEISELLIADGIKASEKTIYGWESGNSQPTPSTLFTLCKYYGIQDVLSTFSDTTGDMNFTNSEKNLISKYRTLDAHGKKIVDTILELEWKHSITSIPPKVIDYAIDLSPNGNNQKEGE